MDNTLSMIQDLLNTKSELEARLALIPYEGTPEVKEAAGRKYISIRKRVHGRLSSRYVGPYSETPGTISAAWELVPLAASVRVPPSTRTVPSLFRLLAPAAVVVTWSVPSSI